jgi:5-methylcytosine-specific restriction endonuclease McrA
MMENYTEQDKRTAIGGPGLNALPQTIESECTQEKISQKALLSLLEDQGYRCALTGEPLDPTNCAADHKLPLSRGGKNCMSNLQLTTKAVNECKGQLTNSEFLAMCAAVCQNNQSNN